jgi:hypothetical protein
MPEEIKMNGEPASPRSAATLGILLAFGLVAGGWILGAQIKATRLNDRYVSVRGLAERKVKSDVAIWLISYKETGDDLPSLYARTEADQNTVQQFLAQQGIHPDEVELGVPRVVDTQANECGGGTKAPHRYIVEQYISVHTPRVDQVAAAARKTMQLVQKGIALGGSYNQGQAPVYKFTGLNAIKPDMITEATRGARAAADRFAADSGSRVGGIRQAYQGVFSILAPDAASETSEDAGEGSYSGGNSSADLSIVKTVRVVTTIQYYLE